MNRKGLYASMRLLGAVGLALFIAGCGMFEKNDKELVDQARQYLQGHELRSAALELRNALQKNPENAEARFMLGDISLTIGDYGSAVKEFKHAMKAGKPDRDVIVKLTEAQYWQHEYNQMLSDDDIRADYPDDVKADLHALRAAALLAAGNRDASLIELKKARKSDPNARWVQVAAAQQAMVEKNWDNAGQIVQQALQTYPDDGLLLLLRAGIDNNAGKSAEAETALDRILSLEPKDMLSAFGRQAKISKAQIDIAGKRLDDARKLINQLLRNNSADPQANQLAGVIAFHNGKIDEADEAVQKALKVAPQFPPALLLAGSVQYNKKNYDQAAYYLNKYIDLIPEDPQGRKLLGQTYMALGKQDDAQKILRAGIQQQQDPDMIALLGLSEMLAGQTNTGISTLKKAVAAAPGDAQLRLRLAAVYLQQGDIDKARAELAKLDNDKSVELEVNRLKILADIRAGNIDGAKQTVQHLLAQKPDDAQVLAMAASVYLAARDQYKARQYFEQALAKKPDFYQVALTLGRLDEIAGQLDKASQRYKTLVDNADPRIAGQAMFALARISQRQGNEEELGQWLEKSTTTLPDELLPQVALAEYYLKQNDLDSASKAIDKIKEKYPDRPSTLMLTGKLYIKQGNNAEAVPVLRKLETKTPKSELVHGMLGEALYRTGRTAEARKELDKALRLNAGFAPALALLSELEIRAGNGKRVSQLAAQARKQFPSTALAERIEGSWQISQGHFDKARSVLQQAWDKEKSAQNAYLLSRAISLSGKDLGAAESVLQGWLQQHPDDANIHQALAQLYQGQKDWDKAAQEYEDLLKQQPANLVALNNLAWYYSQLKKDSDKAAEFGQKAYQIAPDNPGVLDTYGWILVQQGKNEQALPLLEKAIGGLPKNGDVRYHYAVVKYRTGNEDEARKMLQQLLDSGVDFNGKDDARALLQQS